MAGESALEGMSQAVACAQGKLRAAEERAGEAERAQRAAQEQLGEKEGLIKYVEEEVERVKGAWGSPRAAERGARSGTPLRCVRLAAPRGRWPACSVARLLHARAGLVLQSRGLPQLHAVRSRQW